MRTRRFFDVSAQATFYRINVIWRDGSCHFWGPTPAICHGGCDHCGTLADHGTIKGDFAVCVWISMDVCLISGYYFESFSRTLEQQICVSHEVSFSCIWCEKGRKKLPRQESRCATLL